MGRPRKRNIIEKIEALEESVQKTSATATFADVPEKTYEPLAEITKAQKSNAKRIEPRRSLKVKTTKLLEGDHLRHRNYMWEYIEGVFENCHIIGEAMIFWRNPFPGDDYAEWVVPCNTVVMVPRWIAKHLNERKYVTFKHKEKPSEKRRVDDFLEEFVPDQVHHRTRFMPTGTY